MASKQRLALAKAKTVRVRADREGGHGDSPALSESIVCEACGAKKALLPG